MVPDGLNQVRLMGRVYDRPIVRKAKGQTLIKAVLEVEEPKFEDGQWGKRTSYHTVSLFGGIAKVFDKKLDHGVFIYVEGRLHHFPYNDAEGKQHLRTEVMASRVIIPRQEEEKTVETEPETEPEPEPQPAQESPEPPDELSDEDFEHMKKVVPLFPEKDEEVEDEDLLPF